jgi:hypothetical protein
MFLAVRRGLPLTLAAVGLLGAALSPAGRLLFLILALACLAEVWPTFRRGKEYLRARTTIVRRDGLWAKAFRPLARMLDMDDAWVLSFCAWNNDRVWEAFRTQPARRALVLLPHCIQMAACKAPILQDLRSCHACGLCPVGDVVEDSLSRRWNVRIANRSHKAYREAREFHPDLIVAVSCTDRLLKGLVKLPEVPSFAIPLSLPHGMCVDTTFSVPQLLSAMEALVEPLSEPRIQPLQRQEIA